MRQAVFVIRLSKPATQPVSLSYATQNGTATAPADYTSATGTISLDVGQSLAQVIISVRNAASGDAEKFFNLAISAVVGATVVRSVAKCVLPAVALTTQPVVKAADISIPSET